MSEEIVENIEDNEPIVDIEEPVEEPQPKRYKVKVDGEDLDVDEEELLKGYQLSKASHKRFQEASEQMKQIEQLFQIGKQDPSQILQALGVDPLEWIEAYVNSQVEESSLTDEQKELRELRRMKAENDEFLKKMEEEAKQAQMKAKQEMFAKELDDSITSAFEEAGVQPTPKLIARVAEQLLADLNSGKPLDARKALARTQDDIQAELAEFLSSDPSKILSKADRKQLENLRKHFLKDVANVESSDESPEQRQVSNQSKSKRQALEDIFGDQHLL